MNSRSVGFFRHAHHPPRKLCFQRRVQSILVVLQLTPVTYMRLRARIASTVRSCTFGFPTRRVATLTSGGALRCVRTSGS